jgi:RNA polymerase sigma-70 factor (ECF subfamily)
MTEDLAQDARDGATPGGPPRPSAAEANRQDALFEQICAEFAAPLVRLARACEADAALQQDLLQEIHIALWRSLPVFGGRCSLRTWVFRVAHNTSATHVLKRRRLPRNLVSLDDVQLSSDARDLESVADEAQLLTRLRSLIQRLKPLDREVFVLYLEGLGVDEIAEIACLSLANTSTKLHRIRTLLAARLRTGVTS